jgi:hypothetical protein
LSSAAADDSFAFASTASVDAFALSSFLDDMRFDFDRSTSGDVDRLRLSPAWGDDCEASFDAFAFRELANALASLSLAFAIASVSIIQKLTLGIKAMCFDQRYASMRQAKETCLTCAVDAVIVRVRTICWLFACV